MTAATANPILLEAARAFLRAGLSVHPVRADGSKAPALPSGHEVLLQKRRATEDEVFCWFRSGSRVGIAIRCGKISGGLHVWDFDDGDLFASWAETVEDEAPGLLKKLVRVYTPRRSKAGNPGVHVAARVEGDTLKHEDLAKGSRPEDGAETRVKALIETRAEGQYVVVPPSGGDCHASGRGWTYVEDSLTYDRVPIITREEAEILSAVARSFDEIPAEANAPASGKNGGRPGFRPGDDFDVRGDVCALIEETGAAVEREQEGVKYYRRPGKPKGVGASLGKYKTAGGGPLFHVFTSSWEPFEQGKTYSPFAVFALLRHKGDFKAAARDLAAEGFGSTRENTKEDRSAPNAGFDPDLPEIRLGLDLLMVAESAEKVLGESSAEIFSRGGAVGLVRVNRGPATTAAAIRREPGAPIISPVETDFLRAVMSHVACWTKVKSDGEVVQVKPPAEVVRTVMSLGTWAHTRPLAGIITAPVMRPDGSVIDRPGYDPRTGFLAEFSTDFLSVPPAPTLEDARRALADLEGVFCDFPFLEPCDLSAAVAGVLTLFARPSIDGSVPVLAFRAPAHGTGKSLCVDVIAMIATGRMAPRMADAKEEDEYRKRLLAVALAGDPLVLIDNIMKPFGCGALSMAITGRTIRDRLLGESRIVEAPFDSVIFASGNGMTFVGDLPRRVIPVDLDAGVERPEERSGFRQADLLTYVRENRPRLVNAALTVLRAHAVAGRPVVTGMTPFGGFEAWSGIVRACLTWCGRPDPCLGRTRIVATADPETEALGRFLCAWAATVGTFPETLEGAWKKATAGSEELRNSIRALDHRARADSTPSLQTVGAWLRARTGRIVGGLRLIALSETRGGVRLWRVEGTRGTEGSFSSPPAQEQPPNGDSNEVHSGRSAPPAPPDPLADNDGDEVCHRPEDSVRLFAEREGNDILEVAEGREKGET